MMRSLRAIWLLLLVAVALVVGAPAQAQFGGKYPPNTLLGNPTGVEAAAVALTTLPAPLTTNLNVIDTLSLNNERLASFGGTYPYIDIPNNNTFWNDPTGNKASISRITRIFAGAAVINDGNYYPSGCVGCYFNFTDLDWLGQAGHHSYNGVMNIGGGSVNYSQIAVLTDSTNANALKATPNIALTVGAEESASISGATPRAINGMALGNATNSGVGDWAGYWECHYLTIISLNVYCHEVEALNAAGSVLWDTAYFSHSTAIALELGCGAGLPSTGQFNCGPAMYVQANPMQFGSGIDFIHGAIAATGPNGEKPAIQFDADNCICWYSLSPSGTAATPVVASIQSNSTNDILLTTYSGGRATFNIGPRLADSSAIVFGTAGTAKFAGSSASGFLTGTVAGVEQWRATNGNFAIGRSGPIGVERLTINGGVAITDAAQWTAPTNCGSVTGSTKCLTIVDPNGNPMSLAAWGTY